jgi:hypothetical protein
MPARRAIAAAVSVAPPATRASAPSPRAVARTDPLATPTSGATMRAPGDHRSQSPAAAMPWASEAGARKTQVPSIHSVARASAAARRNATQMARRCRGGTRCTTAICVA